jgi:hypothetical protein
MKNNKRIFWIVLTVALLLMVPLIAMQFTDEVKWDLLDFAVAGTLLLGTGLTIDLAIRKIQVTRTRIIVCAAILLGLFLIWAELAVGIFGSPLAGS